MKLKDWADKTGVKYLTAYRWFKAGTLPVPSYQTDSGTIIVDDDSVYQEQNMSPTPQNDALSLFLKKTVEFSKNNSSVEDFAAYVLANFSIKLNSLESPKYSRNKPKAEDIQNHFRQFIPAKGEKPKPNMYVASEEMLNELVTKSDDLTTQELVGEIQKYSEVEVTNTAAVDTPEFQDLMKDLSTELWHDAKASPNVNTLYNFTTDGVINRNVEFSPQQINYTSSNESSLGSTLSFTGSVAQNSTLSLGGLSDARVSNFYAPQAKTLESVSLISPDSVKLSDKPKRGRPRKK